MEEEKYEKFVNRVTKLAFFDESIKSLSKTDKKYIEWKTKALLQIIKNDIASVTEQSKKLDDIYTGYRPITYYTEWIEYYQTQICAPQHRFNPKTRDWIKTKIKELSSGCYYHLPRTLFKKRYSFSEFKISVDNYVIAALDFDFMPRNKQPFLFNNKSLFPLNMFLYESGQGYSSFLFFLHNSPQIILKSESQYLEISKLLKQFYNNHFKIRGLEFTGKELDAFDRAAIKIVNFKEKQSLKIEYEELISEIFKALFENFSLIYPGHLCCDFLFSTLLPNILSREAPKLNRRK